MNEQNECMGKYNLGALVNATWSFYIIWLPKNANTEGLSYRVVISNTPLGCVDNFTTSTFLIVLG